MYSYIYNYIYAICSFPSSYRSCASMQICWTSNTYSVPLTSQIPRQDESKEMINYYQWLPFMLFALAFLFYLPRPVWAFLGKKSGISVVSLTDSAIEYFDASESQEKERHLTYIVEQMQTFLKVQRSFGHSYLLSAYLIIKVLHIVNAFGQILILNKFLGTYILLDFFSAMFSGEQWIGSETFPRVALCSFHIRRLGNVHRYTVQCSMHMNLFNEMFMLVVCFWIVFVAIATLGSLVHWTVVAALPERRRRYVKLKLRARRARELSDNKLTWRQFVHVYLKVDGVFLVKIMHENSSAVLAAEVVTRLWDSYLQNAADLQEVQVTSSMKEEMSDGSLERLENLLECHKEVEEDGKEDL